MDINLKLRYFKKIIFSSSFIETQDLEQFHDKQNKGSQSDFKIPIYFYKIVPNIENTILPTTNLDRHIKEIKMMEGRTIDYRPDGGGLDYHNSPLMAEIPIDNYSHIHRSIEHLRSIGVPPPIDHHRHLTTNLTDLRRYEHSDEMPEIKPSVLRLSEFKNGLHEIRVHQNQNHNDQENEVHRQMTPHDDGPKGYSAPSTPLSENGGQIQEEKVRLI